MPDRLSIDRDSVEITNENILEDESLTLELNATDIDENEELEK